MSAGRLRKREIRQRQHRKEKRRKLRAKLVNAPAHERAGLEAKLLKTYPLLDAARAGVATTK